MAYEFFDGLLLSVSLEKKGRHSYQALNIHDVNLFGERAEERSKIPNPYAGLGSLDMIEALRCELVDDFLHRGRLQVVEQEGAVSAAG